MVLNSTLKLFEYFQAWLRLVRYSYALERVVAEDFFNIVMNKSAVALADGAEKICLKKGLAQAQLFHSLHDQCFY